MAKIISSSTDLHAPGVVYSVWKIALIGAALGAIFWGLTSFLVKFLSLAAAGDVATILILVAGVGLMIVLKMPQPLITALASSAALWGLATWSDGLGWAEVLAWSVGLYCLAYVLFSWAARYVKIVPAVAAILVIVIITRIVVSL